jgi:hypothetical protein
MDVFPKIIVVKRHTTAPAASLSHSRESVIKSQKIYDTIK